MEALPEIASVAWADRVPFLGTGSGLFRNEQGTILACIFNGVSAHYFNTLGIPLLAGRTFTRLEIEQQPPITCHQRIHSETTVAGTGSSGTETRACHSVASGRGRLRVLHGCWRGEEHSEHISVEGG